MVRTPKTSYASNSKREKQPSHAATDNNQRYRASVPEESSPHQHKNMTTILWSLFMNVGAVTVFTFASVLGILYIQEYIGNMRNPTTPPKETKHLPGGTADTNNRAAISINNSDEEEQKHHKLQLEPTSTRTPVPVSPTPAPTISNNLLTSEFGATAPPRQYGYLHQQ